MRLLWLLPFGLSAVLCCTAQTTPGVTGSPVENQGQTSQAPVNQGATTPANPAIAPGGIVPAELTKALDAKKAKPGDRIEARTALDLLAHGQIMLPRNTRVVGHITQAKAHSKDSPDSALGIVFDEFQLKDGTRMPAKLALQAIGRPLQNGVSGTDMDNPGGLVPGGNPRMPGQMSGGTGMGNPGPPATQSPYPSQPTPDPRDSPNSTQPSATTVAPLGPTSQGAVGMRGLTLNSTGDAAVLSSTTQNIHLDGGTQLILRTE